MTQIDIIDALAHDDVEYEGEKNPGDEGVRVEAILVVCDVTETDDVQLQLASAASRVDGEEDRPCYETADEADGCGDLKVSKQEEAVERMVIENIAVWNLIESADPVEHAIGKIWRPLPAKNECQLHTFADGRPKGFRRTVDEASRDSFWANSCA